MKLRRGFFRLWLMLSGVWIIYSIWWYFTKCDPPDNSGVVLCKVQSWFSERYYLFSTNLGHVIAGIFWLPIAGMILGLIAFWVAKGFGERSKSN